jgi:pyrroloquinoline-quinone synthase
MSAAIEADRAPRTTKRATEILQRVNILGNPYFKDLCGGTMPLDVFRKTQQQFFFAVTFFPRPMAALVGRIPNPRQRLDILHNLVEEHGEFHEESFHHTTFQRFLLTLGVQQNEIENAKVGPAVRAFNSVLTASCLMDELEVGVGAMGIIEFAFAGISAAIGKSVVANGWIPQKHLVHYKLHAEIDERHAEEFFAVIESAWDKPDRAYFVEQGLELGAYIFDRLYRDIYSAARN